MVEYPAADPAYPVPFSQRAVPVSPLYPQDRVGGLKSMSQHQSPIYWSFSCGTWFQTQVRVSYFLPLLVLLICFRLASLELGLIFSGIFLASILLHEFGHIVAVRMTGGAGDEILLWPLGGLASVQPAATFASRLMTPAAGPLVNLALCLITVVPVVQSHYGTAVLDPLHFPLAGLSHHAILLDLLAMTFWANWILMLINLVPVYPFDGGRMLQVLLSRRWSGETVADVYLKIGFAVGFLGLIGGLMGESAWVVAIGAFVLLLNLQESYQMRMAETYDESFMGYDFSQGYTSLERSEAAPRERPPGPFERWRRRRRAERERRLREREEEVRRQLDAILEKIKTSGIDSLTEAERRHLDQASALYREKGNEHR